MASEDDLQGIAIETFLPERAVSRKKVMHGDLTHMYLVDDIEGVDVEGIFKSIIH